jgi:hypothetical protein
VDIFELHKFTEEHDHREAVEQDHLVVDEVVVEGVFGFLVDPEEEVSVDAIL